VIVIEAERQMTNWLIGYIAALAVFLVLDMLWLGYIANSVYRAALDGLMLEQIRMVPAVLFYVIYVAGVLVLAVSPAVERGSLMTAYLFGAVLGLVAYATYDLSNAATLKSW
jgi:uncharacterized membrane protein